MSGVLQSGRHPDADALSAFVEQALPLHEREAMLAHLAVCAECRAVVALTQSGAAPLASHAEKPARKPWFGGWTFAWSGAAAVAVLALVVAVYMRHPRLTRGSGSEHAQMTAVRPPAPTLQAERAQNQPAAPPAQAKRQPTRRAAGAHEGQSDNLLALQKPQQQIAGAPGNAPTQGSAFGSIMGSGEAVLKQPAAVPARPEPPAPAAPPGEQAGPLGAPAAAQMNPVDAGIGGRQQNQLAAGAGAAYGTKASNKELKAPAAVHPLPSGLPAISTVVRQGQMLAIDTAHALFLSQDGGARWRDVAVPWKARAVRVSLVSAAGNKKAERQAAFAQRITGKEADEISAASPAGMLTGTITDESGAVIPGASVAVKDAAGHISRTVKTNSDGRYAVGGLAPGTYDIEVHALGFKTGRVSAVAVAPARQKIADMRLDVGTSSQTVMVTAGSESLESVPLSRAKTPPRAAAAPPAAGPSQAAPAPGTASPAAPSPAFEITLDDGSRWTSADGMSWTRE